MSQNPLDTDNQFYFTLRNPNPTSGKNKDGPWYRISFEMNQEEHQDFMDAETKGMVIECVGMVTHRNEEQVKKTKPVKKKAPADNKGGALCARSDILARDDIFHNYLNANHAQWIVDNEKSSGSFIDLAREYIRIQSGVESRKELDHNEGAAKNFHKFVLSPFIQWKKDKGIE